MHHGVDPNATGCGGGSGAGYVDGEKETIITDEEWKVLDRKPNQVVSSESSESNVNFMDAIIRQRDLYHDRLLVIYGMALVLKLPRIIHITQKALALPAEDFPNEPH